MKNYRISALGSIVALIAIAGAVIVGLSIGNGINSQTMPVVAGLFAILSSTIPSILALIKVESVQNDIRNGVVVDKAREGAELAIDNKMVVTRTGPSIMAQIEALQALVKSNSEILQHIVERDKDNGRPGI